MSIEHREANTDGLLEKAGIDAELKLLRPETVVGESLELFPPETVREHAEDPRVNWVAEGEVVEAVEAMTFVDNRKNLAPNHPKVYSCDPGSRFKIAGASHGEVNLRPFQSVVALHGRHVQKWEGDVPATWRQVRYGMRWILEG